MGSAELDEGAHHMLIGVALERDHQIRRAGELAPAPGVELGEDVAVQVDFALAAIEAEREPDLLLPLPALGRLRAFGVRREVVVDPLFGAAQQTGRSYAGLFVQFAFGGDQQVLAVIDAALWELPVVRGRGPGAAAVPDAPILVEEDNADIGTIEGKIENRQGGYLRAMTAEAGASW